MADIRDRLAELQTSLSAFESIPFVLHSADKRLQIFHTSAALCQILGYSRDQLLLRSVSLLESDDEVNGIEIAVRCGQELVVDGVEVRHCNGSTVQTRTHLMPVAETYSKLGLFVRIYHPSSENCPPSDQTGGTEEAVIALWQAVKMFLSGYDGVSLLKARLLHNIPHPKAFIVSDNRLPDCPIVWCSTPFYELFGYDASECLGRTVHFLEGAGKHVRCKLWKLWKSYY
jgi:PAS domain S-box-containing protein